MKRIDQISALTLLLVAAFYGYEASRLPFWKDTTFGSGFFPLFLGLLLAVVSVLILARASLRGSADAPPTGGFLPSREGRIKLVYLVGGLVAAISILELVGFVLTSLVFLSCLFVALEPEKKWMPQLLTAAGIVAVFYVFFVLLLRTQLPRGLLG